MSDNRIVDGMKRANRVMAWVKARHAKVEKRQRQLAFHYLAKSGVFKDAKHFTGEHFHWLHNWVLGVEGVKDNPFAHKALAAWNRVGDGHYARETRIWCLAVEKYCR